MNGEKPTNHLVERAINALKKEYVVVGKTHVRAWHAWLALGLVAGVVSGIFLVASRSGEFEATKAAGVFTKDNGVIRVNLNEGGYPMITSMYILGTEVVPHDNAGADFQMAARERSNYNPTLGGDCTMTPSTLTGYISDWVGGGLNIDPQLGILLGVDPRNYNETDTCLGQGEILPYDFNFGLTLGDDVSLPKQMMVLDMSIKRESGSIELQKRFAEIPVAFPKTSFMRYAYSSPDGQTFEPLRYSNTHDVAQWPYLQLVGGIGKKTVMLCNIPDALERPNEGICMAFYSHFATYAEVSRRRGGREDLTLINLAGDDGLWVPDYYTNHNKYIRGFDWHTLRRIMAVGNVNTVRAVISIANQRITDWGNWRR